MKKDKSTIIILIILIIVAVIGYFAFGRESISDKYDKFKDLIVETKSGKELQTEYSSIKDTNFFIKVPTEFTEMNMEEKKQRFGVDDIDKVYINNEENVNVLMDVLEDKKSNSDIMTYKDDIVNTLSAKNLVKSSKIIEIDKHNVVSVVYEDEYEYHQALYFSYNGYLGTISINIALEIKDEWLPVSDFIIESLYFK